MTKRQLLALTFPCRRYEDHKDLRFGALDKAGNGVLHYANILVVERANDIWEGWPFWHISGSLQRVYPDRASMVTTDRWKKSQIERLGKILLRELHGAGMGEDVADRGQATLHLFRRLTVAEYEALPVEYRYALADNVMVGKRVN